MNFRRLAVLPATALLASLALTGCGTEAAGAETAAPGADADRGPISVLTSFYPLQFVAEQVGGDLVDVDNLTPPGADPHFLELSPARTRDIGEADVVVTLTGFIAAVDDAIEQRRPEIVVDAADIVQLLPASVTGGHSHGPDGECSHGHDHSHGHGHDHSHSHDHADHDHSHGHEHAEDDHDHSHGHSHDAEESHDHSHDHGHSHDEEHGTHYPSSADELLEHANTEDRELIESAVEGHDHSHDHDHEHADEAHDHEHSHSHDDGEESHDHSHSHDHGHSHDMGGYDPHFWLDPILLADLAQPVAEALSQVDPGNAEVFVANAGDLVERLEELDAQFAEALAPFAGATMITNHTAFGYLAYRYGLNQVGITGLDHNVEPSPARMVEIREIARRYDVTTLFYETLVSPRVVQALAGDLGIDAVVIDTLEGLTPAGIEAGDDYISIMLRNLQTLTEGLNAP